MLKQLIRAVLEYYTKVFFRRHHPILIVVVGAVGKTTTKHAIYQVLKRHYRVRMEPTNLNSELSVPLSILGVEYPRNRVLRNPLAWLGVIWRVFLAAHRKCRVDIIIQELATDHPGDIANFGRYLSADIAVVTAVADEHMENFADGIDAVANEELSVCRFAKTVILNSSAVNKKYFSMIKQEKFITYGFDTGDYHFSKVVGRPLSGYNVVIDHIKATVSLLGKHNMQSIAAAVAVGRELGLSDALIAKGIESLVPVPGRMNCLTGKRNSLIIDDTYNSSPIAAVAALDTLYSIKVKHRIAVLGSMNELGTFSAAAHDLVGKHCDPKYLDLVVTIGGAANKDLACAAERAGCKVVRFDKSSDAGKYVCSYMHKTMDQDSSKAILVKGSQNGVFAEEAAKQLIRNRKDSSKLVRQSRDWIERKAKAHSL